MDSQSTSVPPSEEMFKSIDESGGEKIVGEMKKLPTHGDHDHAWDYKGTSVQCLVCRWGIPLPPQGYVKEGHVYIGDKLIV